MTDARSDEISYTYDVDGRKTAEYDTTGGASETSSDELASWIYDTLSKGQLTSSTSYYNGSAYTESVVGYGTYGLPTGTRTIIPSAQGALAGTYTTGDTYDPDTRQLTSVYQSAAGGLPAETPGWGYDTAGDPVSLASSLWTYAPTVSYTEYGQPLQYDLGPSTDPVYVTDAYDQQTQNLTGQQVAIGSTTAVAGAYGYAYDNGRLSVAGMACLKPGRPGRLFYRLRVHRRRKGDRPSMSEADYAHLITAAHHALGAPVILIWDNLNTHRSKKMRAFTEPREDWLTVVHLPGYAPDLNAVEGAWSAMKSGLGNHAAATLDQLEAIVRTRLRTIQRRPELINALLGQTGLTLDPPPP